MLSAAQLDKIRDAFEALESLAEELDGEVWDDYEFDGVASARSALREFLAKSSKL
jgi:hypothetical protein